MLQERERVKRLWKHSQFFAWSTVILSVSTTHRLAAFGSLHLSLLSITLYQIFTILRTETTLRKYSESLRLDPFYLFKSCFLLLSSVSVFPIQTTLISLLTWLQAPDGSLKGCHRANDHKSLQHRGKARYCLSLMRKVLADPDPIETSRDSQWIDLLFYKCKSRYLLWIKAHSQVV